MKRPWHTRRLGAAGLAAMFLISACGGSPATISEPSPTAIAGPVGDGATPAADGVDGEIHVSGSSTVEPVSQAVSEDFRSRNPGFGYTVEGPGTGDGFAAFCEGTTDVSDASRPIKEPEAQACADNGIEYVELKIAYDGMAVLTHPDTPVECLTFADLYALFGPESDDIGNWQDAEAVARELGSVTDLPDMPLQITAPGEESGTYDSFIELAIAGPAEERGRADDALRVPGPNYTASPNDNVIVEGVEAGAGSLGFVGYAFYAEAGEAVKAIAVDGGEGCVEPTEETIADGTYPLSRPLFIYPNVQRAADNRALAAWVDFFLSDDGMANVSETGYVALPAAELEETRTTWQGR
jgi:phosphate transport system substrate-binding protein